MWDFPSKARQLSDQGEITLPFPEKHIIRGTCNDLRQSHRLQLRREQLLDLESRREPLNAVLITRKLIGRDAYQI